MKGYTDLEQSKKLAEILPLESADMYYWLAWRGEISEEYKNIPKVGIPKEYKQRKYLWCPCWSLAALLNLIPKHIKEHNVLRTDIDENTFAMWYDEIGYGVNLELPNIEMSEPVDACYKMIIKLHELNLL